MQSIKRVYDRPYDQVWNSIADMLHADLKCIFKKNDKQAGELETEWVHRMDTEGNKRWMVRATVRKVQGGTEVVLYKKLELQDEVSKSLNKYQKKKEDPSDTPSGGWQRTTVDMASLDELYHLLEKKLAVQK